MGRHPLDPVSLLSGALFFLLGGVFLVGGTAVPSVHAGSYWPLPLVVLGLAIAGMAARSLASARSGPDADPDDEKRD